MFDVAMRASAVITVATSTVAMRASAVITVATSTVVVSAVS